MRLIDADALLHYLRSTLADLTEEDGAYEWAWVDAIHEIEHAPTIGDWISVKDRLPETGTLALVFGSAGAMTVARYVAGAEWVVPGMFSAITHWMPLPAPPKE